MFYDWYDNRRYQPIFMRDTHNRENASFLPATGWLMSSHRGGKSLQNLKRDAFNKSDNCLNLENYFKYLWQRHFTLNWFVFCGNICRHTEGGDQQKYCR